MNNLINHNRLTLQQFVDFVPLINTLIIIRHVYTTIMVKQMKHDTFIAEHNKPQLYQHTRYLLKFN